MARGSPTRSVGVTRRQVDDTTVNRLRHRLSDEHKAQVVKDLHRAPAWVAEIMRRVALPAKPWRGRVTERGFVARKNPLRGEAARSYVRFHDGC